MKPIVIAADGSTAARHAVDVGIVLAARLGVPARVVHVLATPNWEADHRGEPSRPMSTEEQHAMKRALAHAQEHGVEATVDLLSGEEHPADVVAEYAERHGAEMIVVGTRQLGLLQAEIRGSVSSRLVRHSTTPVLVVPSGT